MQERGVIIWYGPEVDPAALGYEVTAFITLEIRQADGHDAVIGELAVTVGSDRGPPLTTLDMDYPSWQRRTLHIMLGVLCELYERSIHILRDASIRCYVLP